MDLGVCALGIVILVILATELPNSVKESIGQLFEMAVYIVVSVMVVCVVLTIIGVKPPF